VCAVCVPHSHHHFLYSSFIIHSFIHSFIHSSSSSSITTTQRTFSLCFFLYINYDDDDNDDDDDDDDEDDDYSVFVCKTLFVNNLTIYSCERQNKDEGNNNTFFGLNVRRTQHDGGA